MLVVLAVGTPQYKTNNPKQTIDDNQLEQKMYEWSRNFAQILQLVKDRHFAVHDIEASFHKAFDSFLNKLDPHSNHMNPKTYQLIQQTMHGDFSGVGIVLENIRNTQDKYLTIVDTIPDGPADKAGIEPMDKIVEINGKPLEGMTTEEATSLLKGPPDTTVHVKIMRNEQQDIMSFDIIRKKVKAQTSLSFYLPESNVYYLALTVFNENAAEDIKNVLEQAVKNGNNGIILDLRNNSGGLLTAAIDICSLFVDKNTLVVTTKDKHSNDIEQYRTSKNPVTHNGVPICILINNYTASAAEIVAEFLNSCSKEQHAYASDKPHKLTVFLIGTKSFGKGSVQEVIPVNNNCAIKLTTSLYYFPDNSTIQGVGIEPDFVVEKTFPPTKQMAWFTLNYGREQAFENHIQVHKKADQKNDNDSKEKEKNSEKRWMDRTKKILQMDNQLRVTISLIKLLNIARQVCPDHVCNREKAMKFLKKNYLTHDTLQIEEIKP